MLNEEKVKYMTKAAAYENGPEKKNMKIDSYFRGDYLGLQLVKSGIAYTLAFCIIVLMWAMGRSGELMLMISRAEYLEGILRTLILLFVSGLILYEISVYTYYSRKYQSAKKSVKGFHLHLKHIHKFYETEESAETDGNFRNASADEENTL